jgi:DNA-binding CsgD family transcriptional regulator/DNA-binding transcriptional MerR regulator
MPTATASWMPIGELSRRLGVSPDLLRKWERRYGVLKPTRTPGNRRLYSRVDQARVELMLRQLAHGLPAAQAAQMAIAAGFKEAPGTGAAVIEHAVVTATNTASFEATLIPMLVADDQRRYVDVNQAACLLLRLRKDDVLRLRIDDLTPPGSEDETEALWNAFIRDGTQSGTFELGLPDGARLPVDYSAKAHVEPGRHLSLLYFPASKANSRSSVRKGSGLGALTEREREVLTLIAGGERGASIASALGVSQATVETHVRRCLVKLGARNRAHAIALGLQRGEIMIRLGTPRPDD